MDVRQLIHKIELTREDGSVHEIFIATVDKGRIPDLIEKNKHWFEQGRINPETKQFSTIKVVRWKYLEEILPFAWSEEKYLDEVAHADIVDELE